MTTPFTQKPPPPGLESRACPDPSAAAQPPGSPCARQSAVVTLPDEIDAANASHVYDALTRALETGTGVVVADAGETTFCDCAGVATLIRAHYQAAAVGIDLRVASATSRKVGRILQLTGAERVLHTYPTLAAALDGPPRAPDTHFRAAGAADPGRGMP